MTKRLINNITKEKQIISQPLSYKIFMERLVIFLIFTIISTSSYSQNDESALKVLDKFSSETLSSPSVSFDFRLITEDIIEDVNDTITGSILLKDNSYVLSMPDNIVWFNGTTSWSYLPNEKEVTITQPDPNDMSFMNKPSLIFTAYKKDYKYRMIDESGSAYIIDLYPIDTKSDLIRLRLSIAKKNYQLNIFEYKQKDGFSAIILTDNYNLTKNVNTTSFVFDVSKYKDVDVIDMR